MSVELGTAVATGVGLGLVTAVSPCPLATNLAATAWLARHAGSRRRALLAASMYSLGRVAAYGAIVVLLYLGGIGAPGLSQALQEWLPPLLGPLLVLAAMVLLDLLPLPWPRSGPNGSTAQRLAGLGVLGEFALGALFALTFCPASAALFFGSLLPVALASPNAALPVAAYGLGTATPVAAFAIGIACSAGFANRLGGSLQAWQPRLKWLTGALLLLAGLWLIARDTLQLIA